MAHSARPKGAIAQGTLAEPIAPEPLPPTVAFTMGNSFTLLSHH